MMEFPSSESVKPPEDAPSPFNNVAANTILRSSNSVDFQVHSVILAEASPYFRQKFSDLAKDETKGGGGGRRDGRPVIIMTENSTTLNNLLRLCYPITDPVLEDLKDVEAVLEAAMKYEMTQATVQATEILRSFAKKEPLRVWAIACRLRLEEQARFAAEHALQISIVGNFPSDSHGLTAGTLFRLADFIRAGGKVDDHFTFCDLPAPRQEPEKGHSSAILVAASEAQPVSDDFFAQPSADLICRSSDAVDFRVHKIIISIASPALRSVISGAPTGDLPTQVSTSPDDMMVLHFEEDSCTLAPLLKLCYPVEDPDSIIDDMLMVEAVAQAAVKYEMERVSEVIMSAWKKFATSEPLRAYMVIASSKLDSLAAEAASRSLRFAKLSEQYIPEMERVPADLYHRLLKYRDGRSEAARKVNRELHLKSFWAEQDTTSSSDPERRRYCSCKEELPLDTKRRKCLGCVKTSLNEEFRARLENLAKRPEPTLSGHRKGGMMLYSVQKGYWCSDCEQIATFWTLLDGYIQDKYWNEGSQIHLERP